MNKQAKQGKFSKARKQFNQFFYSLPQTMRQLSDDEVLGYLAQAKTIRRSCALFFLLYFITLKFKPSILSNYSGITLILFFLWYVISVLVAFLTQLEAVHTSSKQDNASNLREATVAKITAEKYKHLIVSIIVSITIMLCIPYSQQ